MKSLAVVCLVFAGCAGHAKPFYVSPLGVTHTDELTRANTIAWEEATYRDMVSYGWPMERVRVALSAAYVENAQLPEGTLGITEGYVIRLRPMDEGSRCAEMAVYIHELWHLVGAYLGMPGKYHLEPWWKLLRQSVPVTNCL